LPAGSLWLVADGHLLGTIWEEKGIIGEKGIFALAIGVITGFLVGVLFFFSFCHSPFFLGHA
jgi:hypothetical protein